MRKTLFVLMLAMVLLVTVVTPAVALMPRHWGYRIVLPVVQHRIGYADRFAR